MKKLRKRINRIWQRRPRPFRKLWKWARVPDKLARVMRRWKALKLWAREHAKIASKRGNNTKRKWWLERQQRYDDKYDAARKKFLAQHDDPHEPPTQGVSTPSAPWNPYARPIANWIIPWLERSWDAGWRGVVNSGYRSPEYSEQLCYQMCGAPSCPGRCAGRSSNHCNYAQPGGAVDVSDYYTFAAVQDRIGSPLWNNLPSDRVHFSSTGG